MILEKITHDASATTRPPLFTSIAARGVWSQGRTLDVLYFQFAAGGDHCKSIAARGATTRPPLFTSIAARGVWRQGRTLYIYFQFAAGGCSPGGDWCRYK
jgi:hypothetical protein